MINWFMELSASNQIAIIVAGISAGGGIIVAIINGLFNIILKNKRNKTIKDTVNQTIYDNEAQSGVQIADEKMLDVIEEAQKLILK